MKISIIINPNSFDVLQFLSFPIFVNKEKCGITYNIKTGTGFSLIYKNNIYIVTAAHVVDNDRYIESGEILLGYDFRYPKIINNATTGDHIVYTLGDCVYFDTTIDIAIYKLTSFNITDELYVVKIPVKMSNNVHDLFSINANHNLISCFNNLTCLEDITMPTHIDDSIVPLLIHGKTSSHPKLDGVGQCNIDSMPCDSGSPLFVNCKSVTGFNSITLTPPILPFVILGMNVGIPAHSNPNKIKINYCVESDDNDEKQDLFKIDLGSNPIYIPLEIDNFTKTMAISLCDQEKTRFNEYIKITTIIDILSKLPQNNAQ